MTDTSTTTAGTTDPAHDPDAFDRVAHALSLLGGVTSQEAKEAAERGEADPGADDAATWSGFTYRTNGDALIIGSMIAAAVRHEYEGRRDKRYGTVVGLSDLTMFDWSERVAYELVDGEKPDRVSAWAAMIDGLGQWRAVESDKYEPGDEGTFRTEPGASTLDEITRSAVQAAFHVAVARVLADMEEQINDAEQEHDEAHASDDQADAGR